MKEEEPKAMLREFYSLQEERIRVYKSLDEGHKAYLATAPDYDFVAYRQIVHDRTEDFKRISARIMSIGTTFREEYQKIAIADCMQKIQKTEQEKLEMTAALQLTNQRLKDEPDVDVHEMDLSDLKHKLAGLMEKITDTMEDLKYESEGL